MTNFREQTVEVEKRTLIRDDGTEVTYSLIKTGYLQPPSRIIVEWSIEYEEEEQKIPGPEDADMHARTLIEMVNAGMFNGDTL